MSLPPPDMSTREGLALYRAELANVAKPLRWGGLTCVMLGVIMLFQTNAGWHSMAERMFGFAGLVLIVIGWILMIVGIVRRTRYHKQRTKDL
jgi:hypothetical protein